MLVLKQSTSIDIRLGPFMAIADGYTPITAAQTLTNWDQAEVLKENGAATSAMAGTIAAVTGCGGWYDYTVGTGDVDTLGEIVFVCQDESVFLPVFVRAMVVSAGVYDALYSGTGTWLTNLSTSALGIITGTAVTGTLTTTSFTTSLTTGYATSELVNRTIIFYGSASNAGCAGVITSSTSGGLIGITGAIATAPANTDTFVIV